MNKTVVTTAVAAVLALAAMATVVGSARATYPGETNGRLAFGININGNTDVYSVEPNGQDLQRLTTSPAFDACAAYSADGSRIAYCSGASGGPVQVWTMNQDGSDKQQVTHMGVLAIFPDFSPDGSKIVFCAGPSSQSRDIYVVNTDGSDLTKLTSGVGNGYGNNYPAFSPNGRKIVFTSNRTGTSQVWVMNADGSDQRQLTFDPQPKDQVPDWSPNGSKIAYLADTHGISDVVNPSWGDIWVMNANGSHQHQITHDASYYGTAWSPDGTRIATMDMPTRTIYTVDARDGSDAQAVHPGGLQFVPGWQPLGAENDQGEGEDR
jgi:TolB protein